MSRWANGALSGWVLGFIHSRSDTSLHLSRCFCSVLLSGGAGLETRWRFEVRVVVHHLQGCRVRKEGE